ncbi:MAG: hypothetical protein AABW88_01615 [Nanoarchaeota archaeon]
MATTVQLEETTKQLLDTLKIKERKKTYNELIRHLAETHTHVKDMFGSARGKLKPFTKEDKLELHEL